MGFLPEGPNGSQPPFPESQKLIAWASRISFFRHLPIPVGYRNHFLGCRRLGYPDGSDSPSIRSSMLANKRLVKWLSASSNEVHPPQEVLEAGVGAEGVYHEVNEHTSWNNHWGQVI